MTALFVQREGDGPEILLVHGGASPDTTWGALAPLRARWTLATVHRRGYPPSPPRVDGRHDFEADAADLLPLLASRPHVVAHSYGVLGTLIAAGRRPQDVRSLTLIEPPLYRVVHGDPEVERLERIGDAVLTDGLDTDPETLRAFLRISGAPGVDDGPLPAAVAHGVRRATAGAFPARPGRTWTGSATPRSPRSWRRVTTRPRWSASATPSPACSAQSGWSPPAPATSSPRHRGSPSRSSAFSAGVAERRYAGPMRARSAARCASWARSVRAAASSVRMTSPDGTGLPPSRPPRPQSAACRPSGPATGTETHHVSPSRSPVPAGVRGTLGSWTTSRAPPSRSASHVAVPGRAGGSASRSQAAARIARDLGGRTAQDPAADDVDARDVGHRLDRQRAQRLEPVHLRGWRRGGEGHRHDGARSIGPRCDVQRLHHRADDREPLTGAGESCRAAMPVPWSATSTIRRSPSARQLTVTGPGSRPA